MNIHEIDQTLAQVEAVIELLNGQGFQQKVNLASPPFGPQEAKTQLDDVWTATTATDAYSYCRGR